MVIRCAAPTGNSKDPKPNSGSLVLGLFYFLTRSPQRAMTIMSCSFSNLPCVCGRACVIEKKLQERFRKVSFADSEKPEIIVKPGQGSPTHREQNLRGLPKAHERAAPSQCLKSMILWDGGFGLGADGGCLGRRKSAGVARWRRG